MYDAVFVLFEGFNKFVRKKTDKNNPRRTNSMSIVGPTNLTLDCNSKNGVVSHFEHGEKIVKLLRKVRRSKKKKKNTYSSS